jgi:hypothetical protein
LSNRLEFAAEFNDENDSGSGAYEKATAEEQDVTEIRETNPI